MEVSAPDRAPVRTCPQNVLAFLQQRFRDFFDTWRPHPIGENGIQEPDLSRAAAPPSKAAQAPVAGGARGPLPFFDTAPPVVEEARSKNIKERDADWEHDKGTLLGYFGIGVFLWVLNRRRDRAPDRARAGATSQASDRIERDATHSVTPVVVPSTQQTVFFSEARGVAGKDIDEQLDASFEHIRRTLATVSMTLQDLVKLTVFLTQDDQIPAFRLAMDRNLGRHTCIPSCIVVRSLATEGALCEMEGYAAK